MKEAAGLYLQAELSPQNHATERRAKSHQITRQQVWPESATEKWWMTNIFTISIRDDYEP